MGLYKFMYKFFFLYGTNFTFSFPCESPCERRILKTCASLQKLLENLCINVVKPVIHTWWWWCAFFFAGTSQSLVDQALANSHVCKYMYMYMYCMPYIDQLINALLYYQLYILPCSMKLLRDFYFETFILRIGDYLRFAGTNFCRLIDWNSHWEVICAVFFSSSKTSTRKEI